MRLLPCDHLLVEWVVLGDELLELGLGQHVFVLVWRSSSSHHLRLLLLGVQGLEVDAQVTAYLGHEAEVGHEARILIASLLGRHKNLQLFPILILAVYDNLFRFISVSL